MLATINVGDLKKLLKKYSNDDDFVLVENCQKFPDAEIHRKEDNSFDPLGEKFQQFNSWVEMFQSKKKILVDKLLTI